MKKYLKCLGLLFFLAGNLTAIAQEKRLKDNKVPEVIKTYLKASYPGAENLKYYQETEEGNTFIAAEFKQDGKEYALEFLPDGKLHEVEIEVEFQQLPEEVRNQIGSKLKQQFTKYRILECEIVNPGASALYELNVKGYTSESRKFYEMYFDEAGQLVKSSEIILKPIQTLF